MLPEDDDNMTSKGTHFQNKLVFSSSLASVQRLAIPWMLIHLTGAYHRLVDVSAVVTTIYCAILVVRRANAICVLLIFSCNVADTKGENGFIVGRISWKFPVRGSSAG